MTGGRSEAQLDGRACWDCGRTDGPMTPVRLPGRVVFRHDHCGRRDRKAKD